ncbi:MAG: hypothetical protein J7L66_01635 [Anaerolineaceae bacterium]|nr:hypothetical protein [Anaerolineaceae bacterium]
MAKKKGQRKIGTKLSVLRELFSYLWQQKLWWMIPMIIILIFVVGLLIFAQSSPIAPFIYTLF